MVKRQRGVGAEHRYVTAILNPKYPPNMRFNFNFITKNKTQSHKFG